jgi:uncharacterized membrane protein
MYLVLILGKKYALMSLNVLQMIYNVLHVLMMVDVDNVRKDID